MQTMTLASYGLGLELCFFVNAVAGLWGGLYRRIVKRQEVMAKGKAAADRVLATENYESIAVEKLGKCLRHGVALRQGLWFAARFSGGIFASLLYLGSVHILDVPIPDVTLLAPLVPHWSVVELAFAYLSPLLVAAMAVTCLLYELRAKGQLGALEERVRSLTTTGREYEIVLDAVDSDED